VRDGVDFLFTGRVRRVDTAGIRRYLDDGAIVLISTLGYSPTGETFNLSLEDVAVQCAAAIHADKLLMFGREPGVQNANGRLIRQCSLSEIPSLTGGLSSDRKALLETAAQACRLGVKRCHLISFEDDCALLEELFTHDGSGTLVSADPFERARRAAIDDVGGILELIEPLERDGVLVKRSRELLETEIGRFRLLERDSRILACAALYPFPEDGSGEIACIVTHPEYRGEARARRLLTELESEARSLGLNRVFVLTTQTAHWFLEQGFALCERSDLPAERQKLYNLQRKSKVLFKAL
jgi:amino-acid N-acetyltransferase